MSASSQVIRVESEEERQRMNVRAVRVTLASALRHAPPHETDRCIERARQLLAHARSETTIPGVFAEIDALEAQLDWRPVSTRDQDSVN